MFILTWIISNHLSRQRGGSSHYNCLMDICVFFVSFAIFAQKKITINSIDTELRPSSLSVSVFETTVFIKFIAFQRIFRCFSSLAQAEWKRIEKSQWLSERETNTWGHECVFVWSPRVALIAWLARAFENWIAFIVSDYFMKKKKKERKTCQLSATNTNAAIRGMYHMECAPTSSFIRCV